jgi:glycyl-tRNA synthetase beta subunit
VLDFIKGRMEVVLSGQGYTPDLSYAPDLIDAVLATDEVNVIDILERASVLKTFREGPDFDRVYPALNRVLRILPDRPPRGIQPNLFQDEAEKQLGKVVDAVEAELSRCVQKRDYQGLLTRLGELQPAIDQFFDDVMVMAEDTTVRSNRLALLNAIAQKVYPLADLTKLVIAGN